MSNQMVDLQNELAALAQRVAALERRQQPGIVSFEQEYLYQTPRAWSNKYFLRDGIPSGYSWATGSAFTSPSSVVQNLSSISIRPADITTTGRAFLYSSTIPDVIGFFGLIVGNTDGEFIGVRLDDGDDSDYIEFGQILGATSTTGAKRGFEYRQRVGGGSITTVTEFTTWDNNALCIPIASVSGTKYTSWGILRVLELPRLFISDYQKATFLRGGTSTGKTFTPTRAGVVFDANGSSADWHYFYLMSILTQ